MSADKGSSDAKLFRALQLVNDWLKFGEAKHGALLTLNGAAIVAMHNMAKLYGPLDWPADLMAVMGDGMLSRLDGSLPRLVLCADQDERVLVREPDA